MALMKYKKNLVRRWNVCKAEQMHKNALNYQAEIVSQKELTIFYESNPH